MMSSEMKQGGVVRVVDAGFIRESFIKYWQKNNFERLNPISVVPSQDWFNTLFVNAGLVRYLQIIKQEHKLSYSLVSCQPCIKLGFRMLSLEEMVMKDGYFTFFEQLTCGGNESISESWFIGKVWEYLTVVAGLVPERIFIGVSSLQPEYRDYWVEAGARIENILFPDPEAFILHLEREDVRGVYSPFYYDRGKNHPLACQKPSCGTNCSCGRFLELGDIGIVYAGKARIIDHGIGLERIVAVQNVLTRVTDIEEFTMVINVFKEKLEVDDPISLVIADHLRSTIILLAYGVRPGNKGREYALRRLLRRLFRLLPQVNKSQDFENLYCQVFAGMSNYLPYLKVQKDIVITPALEEFEKYQNLLAQGRNILRRFLRRRKNTGDLTEEEKGFLYETYGFSSEIIDAILADLHD